jgi:hypothetical protein
MKAIEKLSTTSTATPVIAAGIHAVEFAAKRCRLALIFGASLVFIGHAVHADEQQGAGNILAPPTGLRIAAQEEPPEKINKDTAPGKWEGTSPHMNPGSTPGRETPRGDTTFDTEEMNRGSAPDTENINKDTTGPGGDNMMRDAIPGGSGLKRE